MRITNNIQYREFLDSLDRVRQRLVEGQLQLATSRKINKPSDDPAGAGEALGIRQALARLDRYDSNGASVRAVVTAADSALSSLTDVLTSAREKAVQGASDTNDPTSRNAIADEIDALRQQVFLIARTKFEGRYIFAGTDTRTDPYDAAGNYLGNGNSIQVETADGETTTANIPGSSVFGTGSTPAGIFGTLAQLSADLRSGNTVGIQAGADAVEAARVALSPARTELGQRINRLDAVAGKNSTDRVSLTARLSAIEDANLPQVITQVSSDTTAEQLTLQAGARIRTKSLFDFIG
jgi:flagellar hook-associated protein 3 FlgL